MRRLELDFAVVAQGGAFDEAELNRPVNKKSLPFCRRLFKLSDQVSNLDSSEPKSDVLPVTPSDKLSF